MASLTPRSLNSFLEIFNQCKSEYNIFIESGTLGGETISNLQSEFQILYTIELSEKYFELFDKIKKEKKYFNVRNYHGDTIEVLPKILQSLNSQNRSIFWLDGHWSSFDTARGLKDCPLIEECTSIDLFYNSDRAIILIDDYRLFGTYVNEDWSNITLENIILCFKRHKVFHKVIDDILILFIEKNVDF